jgi:hypothetical protein
MEQLTLSAILAASPAPWTSQVNFDGIGGCRMIDAKGAEVPLLSIIAFAGILTATIAMQKASQQPAQAQQPA